LRYAARDICVDTRIIYVLQHALWLALTVPWSGD